MSKKGAYNSTFFNHFAERIHGTPIRFGVLIGTEAEDGQRDAVFAAPTPPHPGGGGEGEGPAPKDVPGLLKSKPGGTPFADWAAEHAAQIRKLLPGGLEPCGCFAVVSEAAAKDLAPLLVPVLRGISDALVLTIDPGTRKMAFWQYVGGAKPALRPAQVKPDPHREALLLWAAAPLDLLVPVPGPDASEADEGEAGPDANALADAVEKAVAAALERCTMGFSADDGATPLQVVDFTSERLLSAAAPKDASELRCALLHNGSVLAAAPNPDAKPCLRLRCLVVATALTLRRGVELRHAVAQLRKELAASAAERLRLALEEEGEGNRRGSFFLPWRALLRPEGLEVPLWCGDYCMPDEEPSAARERLAELLGVPEASFESAPEHLDERGRLSRDFGGTYRPESLKQGGPAGGAAPAAGGASPGGKGGLPMAACAAAAVALAAAAALPLLMR